MPELRHRRRRGGWPATSRGRSRSAAVAFENAPQLGRPMTALRPTLAEPEHGARVRRDAVADDPPAEPLDRDVERVAPGRCERRPP